MRVVFADTCYYLALLLERDQYAELARNFTKDFAGEFVTTTAVLTEVGNWLSRNEQRSCFMPFVDYLFDSSEVDVVHASYAEWERAGRLYDERPDKSWSLTDCLSFVVMQDRELTEALTADHHFEQAGFTILLK